MQTVVLHIKTFFWHNPPIGSIFKYVLMKVAYTVGISFIYLSKALVFYCLAQCLTINF